MKNKILLVLTLLIASGCATQTFTLNSQNDAMLEPNKSIKQPFFFSGLAQEKELDAAEVCGGVDKVHMVKTKKSFTDHIIAGFTYGIFTPLTAEVYCLE